MKNIIKTGIGLSLGSAVVGKIGGDSKITGNIQHSLGIASLALPIMGAAKVTDSLYGKKSKKTTLL